MIGKQLKNYKLLEVIGTGGMSTVYLGRDINTGRLSAVKVLKKQYTTDNDHIERFFTRQIELTGDLNHINIVKLLDYGIIEGTYFLVYELIQGISLDRYIKKHKLTLTQIESLSFQILSGLSYAHKKGLIHRDIKPQNILIDSEGRAKITDFGIARALSSTTITQTGMFIGSPGYVSPEQADGKKVDTSADLYSFGVVLFEMLSKRLPFTSDTPWGIVNKHINEVPPDISKIVKNIPSYLAYIVSKCLVKSPQGRFSSADEIISVLEDKSFAAETIIKDFRADKANEDYDVSPPPEKKSSNMKKVGIAVGAVVAFIIIISIIVSVAGKANREVALSNIDYENAPRIEEIILSSTKVSPGETIDIDFNLDKGNYNTIEWIAADGQIKNKNRKNTQWTAPDTPGTYSLSASVSNNYNQSDIRVINIIVGDKVMEPTLKVLSLIAISKTDIEANGLLKTAIKDNYAFSIAGHLNEGIPNSGNLKIIDISNVENPKAINDVGINSYVTDLFIEDNFVFVSFSNFENNYENNTCGLKVIHKKYDRPTILDSIEFDGNAQSIFVRDGFLFLANNSSEGNEIKVLDIKNISESSVSKDIYYDEYSICINRQINSLFVEDGYLYIVGGILNGENFFEIWDISDIKNPYNIAGIIIQEFSLDLTIHQNYAFITYGRFDMENWSCREGGVTIVDLKNKYDPLILKTINTPGLCTNVSIDNNFLFATYGVYEENFEIGNGGIRIEDIFDINKSNIAGSLDDLGFVYDVDIWGNHMFLSLLNDGLRIYKLYDN